MKSNINGNSASGECWVSTRGQSIIFFFAYETIYLTKQGIGSIEILYKIDAYLIHSLDFIVKILNPLPRVIYKIHASIKYNVHVNYTEKRVNSMIMSTKLKLSYFRWNSSLSIYDIRFLARIILESHCMDMKDDVLKLLI